MSDEVTLDPLAPGYLADPYASYARLREHNPVLRDSRDFWYLARYDHCSRLLRDPGLSVEDDSQADTPYRRATLAGLRAAVPEIDRYGNESLLNRDPPEHTRLRQAMSRAFTPRRVATLRPRVQAFVDEVLQSVDRRGHTDLIADLAFPLPLQIISELLGLPYDSHNQYLRGLSKSLLATLDPLSPLDEIREGVRAKAEMVEFLNEVIVWKRSNPGADVLTALIELGDVDGFLSEGELRDQALLLFVAGHETTANLIGNGVLSLLRHRRQYESLVADPTLITNGVEELLRFESPVQVTRRITLAPLDMGGRTIPTGSLVFAVLGSANRDPDHWGDDADRLDLRREGAAQHLAFGAGIHHCLGAALARVEGQVALGSIAAHFPRLELGTDVPAWNERMIQRGLQRLPLTVR